MVAFSHELITLDIPRESTLEQVMEKTRGITFGGTDCGLPMLWAMQNKGIFIYIDVVFILNI